jgi:outer membrane receptor protein involved in Fe transport
LPGHLTLAINLNHLDTWLYTALDGTTTQCAGVLCSPNNIRSQPKWRGVFSATYDAETLSVQWRTRYIGRVADSANGMDFLAVLNGGNTATIGSYLYHDLAVSYGVTKKIALIASIQNVFNKTAPLLYDAGGQDGTDNALYDVVGRYYRLTIEGKF